MYSVEEDKPQAAATVDRRLTIKLHAHAMTDTQRACARKKARAPARPRKIHGVFWLTGATESVPADARSAAELC